MKVRQAPIDQTVLLVDDEKQVLFAIDLMLRSAGIAQVVTLDDSRKVMPLLKERNISLVVLDLSMPFIAGRKLLSGIRQEHPDIPVIVMTGESQLETAVQCMKDGAVDYLVKPAEEERFMTSVRIALEVRTLKTEVMELKQQLLQGKVENPAAFAGIITASRQMRAVFQYLETVSVSLHPMLITGETGVGKELFAQAVHNLSSRRGQFIAVNVAGLEETAFSDTLFGHAKGAYTGADSRREGMIVKASGGTLFLDEIGDLKDQLQVKLLRLLQDNLYYPLGQDIQVRSEARIVVATNQDLTERMNSGLFRKDLFYRLRFHHVHIPPLRERKEDIPLLLDHFVREAASSLGKKTPPVPIEIYPLLNSYHFPGNVREFKAMVHDAVTRHVHGTLSLATFREHIRQGNTETGRDYSPAAEMNGAAFSIQGRLPTLKESEEYLIKEALDRANGNQGIAAAMLGLTRQALNKRLLREKKSDGSTNMP